METLYYLHKFFIETDVKGGIGSADVDIHCTIVCHFMGPSVSAHSLSIEKLSSDNTRDEQERLRIFGSRKK